VRARVRVKRDNGLHTLMFSFFTHIDTAQTQFMSYELPTNYSLKRATLQIVFTKLDLVQSYYQVQKTLKIPDSRHVLPCSKVLVHTNISTTVLVINGILSTRTGLGFHLYRRRFEQRGRARKESSHDTRSITKIWYCHQSGKVHFREKYHVIPRARHKQICVST